MRIENNNLYTHFVFTTINRLPFISNENRVQIEKHITRIINCNECLLYAIYANPEHVHFLISHSPKQSVENIANIVANGSAKLINENKLCIRNFEWQMTALAFSVSKAEVEKLCKYIFNQPQYHRKIDFIEEYDSIIKFYQKPITPK